MLYSTSRCLSAAIAVVLLGGLSLSTSMLTPRVSAITALHASGAEYAPDTSAARHHTLAVATPVYVAIGASDAFGIGTEDPLTQSWPYDLAHQATPTPRLVNLGIPGATMDLALRAELPVALAVQPTLVTVWLGVNDIERHVSLDTFDHQLQTLLAGLRRDTIASIYVANVPDLTLFPYFAAWDQTALAQQVQTWNDAIEVSVAAAGAHLVDIQGNWRDLATHPDYLAADHFHPSARGAQRIAEIFLTEIARSEQRPSIAERF